MALFRGTVSFHFDKEYEFDASNHDDAEEKLMELAREWLPYSSELGYTEDWYSVDIEYCDTDDELDEDE